MAAGMLSGLLAPKYGDIQQDNRDEEARLRAVAQMDPFQQAGYASLSGGRLAGQGLGTAVASAAGVDVRSPGQRNQEAVEAAKAQVSQLGFNPDDPKSIDEFYRRVIQILQQQRLLPEAMEVAREWHKQKNEDAATAAKTDEVARKAARDKMQDSRAIERNAVLAQRLGQQAPEVIRLLGMLDEMNASDALKDPYKEKALQDRINALTAPKGIKIAQAGDHYDIIDANGNKIGSGEVEAKPLNDKDQAKLDQTNAGLQTKYDQTKLSLQTNYNSAAELYRHPGLKEATGVVAGLISKGSVNQGGGGLLDVLNRSRLSESARSAVAKIAQVQGQTFIGALIDLKASSSTGASGLGSLTEVEGAKIQNAKAALDPQQPYPSYRANLAQYMQQIAQSSQVIDESAKRLGLNVKPLSTSGGTGSSDAPAAPAAPAASGDRVRVKMPDGTPGSVPRDKLDAAKAQGAVEIK